MTFENTPPADCHNALAAEALHRITTASRRLLPEDLFKVLALDFKTDRRTVRKTVNRLVQSGEIQYTYEFGCSFLVTSVNRPITVSPRIVLSPQGFAKRLTSGQVRVVLSHGAAFGTGGHPTTRLALRAIDHVLSALPPRWAVGSRRVLDVGTGSGVLLLAALQLGMTDGIGLDLDPCAVSEARENAALNGLAERAQFMDAPLDRIEGAFSLVTANLRLPTLIDMAASITAMSTEDAILVVSGIRDEEAEALQTNYEGAGWEMMWQETDTGWAGQAYARRSS